MKRSHPANVYLRCLLIVAGMSWALIAFCQQPNARERPDQIVVVTLLPSGFEQSEFTTPAGITFLSVSNQTFDQEVVLLLDREAGARLRTSAFERSKPIWRDTVVLTPGKYVLGVQGHPEWTARLTVTPSRSK